MYKRCGFFAAALAVILTAVPVTVLLAEDLDGGVKRAVDALAMRISASMEVSVGDFFLAGTQTPSGLSRHLEGRVDHHAANNSRIRLKPRTRGLARVSGYQKGIIQGTFTLEGDMVRITIKLVSESTGESLGSNEFTIPRTELERLNIAVLPQNLPTPNDVIKQEEILGPAVDPAPAPPPQPPRPGPAPTPAPQTNAQEFRIAAWPNSDSGTYIDGDGLEITLEADRDCYFKVYHIDVNNRMQLLYPNQINRDNVLRANTKRTIPEPGTVKFNAEAPYGQETILVAASTAQFENMEKEFGVIKQATKELVNTALERARRGIGIKPDNRSVVTPGQIPASAETRFNITILPRDHADAVFSYRKPADMAGTVQTLRTDILRRGGTFTGDERQGSYTADGMWCGYQVSGETVTVRYRRMGNENGGASRGAARAFNFSFDKPRNLGQALQSVRSGIEGKGGVFSGNDREGSFRASGIAGRYDVAEKVTVTIHEKPVVIPNGMIEREVRSYFGAR
ncbi:MAG: DUF4384 domain-containing protein [Treponema sp.]|jgi:hypothetical protein|nr:DUF4384 domain-containing protein [Treponema sp.]